MPPASSSDSWVTSLTEGRWQNLRDRGADGVLLAVVVYSLLATALYRNTVDDWFLPDEVITISEIAELDLIGVLTHGESFGNFVPLLFVSLWVDWKLFGLDPTGYHVHSIAAAVIIAVLSFVLMRRWLREPIALAAGACVFLAPPTVAVTSWICTRHYLEGTIFALIGVLVLIRFLDSPSPGKALACGGLYIGACIGKEIFAALPAALIFMPFSGPELWPRQGSLTERLRVLKDDARIRKRAMLAAGLILGLVFYIVWRLSKVGAVLTKYGYDVPVLDRLHYFAGAWPWFSGWMASRGTEGPGFLAGFVLVNVLVLGIIAVWSFKKTSKGVFFAATLLAACLPSVAVLNAPGVRFLEVANHFCLRFVYLPAIVVILWTFYTSSLLKNRTVASVAAALLVIWFAVAGSFAVRPWSVSARMTRGATEVYAQWWDRQAVVVSDINIWLHKGLYSLWSLEQGTPEVRAQVLSTRRTGRRWLSPNDPLLQSPDTVYVLDLQWRRKSRILPRDEFIDRYVHPD